MDEKLVTITLNPENCINCEHIELKSEIYPNGYVSPKQYFCRIVDMYLSTKEGNKALEGTVPRQNFHCEMLIYRATKPR